MAGYMMLTDEDLDIFDREEYKTMALPVNHNGTQDENCPVKPEVLPPDMVDSAFTPIGVTDKQLKAEVKGEINRAMLKQELENADLYLHNAHRMFKACTTVASFNSLVRNALMVQKQRRASLEHAMKLGLGEDTEGIEVDPVTGEVIRRK